MFKSQFVLLSLQIVLGFSLKSEASLVSSFPIQSSPRPLFSLFSDSCPMRPGTSKILAKMRNWKWIEQSHILAPFCFHRIQLRSQVSLLFVLQSEKKRTPETRGDNLERTLRTRLLQRLLNAT